MSDKLISASRPSPELTPIAAFAPVDKWGTAVVDGSGGASEGRGAASVLGFAVVMIIGVVRVGAAAADTLDVLVDVVVCAGDGCELCWPAAPSSLLEAVGQE